MATITETTYGEGGYDPSKPNDNIVEERTVEVPHDPQEAARQRFRDAVSNATSIADLKAALLGTNTGAEPDVKPGR